MFDIYTKILESLKTNKASVLATVVATRGSTPQKPGAKMLICEDGSYSGTVGGGCVEGDIWHQARQILKENREPAFHQYHLNEEMAARDGLVCGGTMYFYLEPIRSAGETMPFTQDIIHAISGGPSLAALTVMAVGNSGLKRGNRLTVHEDESCTGSLGNIELDYILSKRALELLPHGQSNHLEKLEDGIEIFIEVYSTPATLYILGAGHIAISVCELAAKAGFQVNIIDDRDDFATENRFPGAHSISLRHFEEPFKDIIVNPHSYLLIATRGHRYDDFALTAAMETNARYIGLLGSKRKVTMIYKSLQKSGVGVEQLLRVHAPVGLDIGAVTPNEIAISIVSELIAVRNNRTGGFLRMDVERLQRILSSAS